MPHAIPPIYLHTLPHPFRRAARATKAAAIAAAALLPQQVGTDESTRHHIRDVTFAVDACTVHTG
ncbi:hypothetical protein GCM10009603_16090 [Nocardiopsis exhalans]